MGNSHIIDPSSIDSSTELWGKERIQEVNPQRGDMRQLDAILALREEEGIAIGRKDVGDEEFWVDGHIPGNPLYPGCLQLESAAQLCSFFYGQTHPDDDRFIGFGGVEDVRFRAPVEPNSTLFPVAKKKRFRSRVMIFECETFQESDLVFEGKIIGVPMAD